MASVVSYLVMWWAGANSDQIDGLMQKRHNPIANALELVSVAQSHRFAVYARSGVMTLAPADPSRWVSERKT